MVNWNFNKDVEQKKITALPIGNYRCRIEEATEEKSTAGNDMIKLVLAVSGSNSKLFFYIVFMPEGNDKNGKPLKDITDRNLATIYETFGIPEGSLEIGTWIGKVGGVKVKHEMYNGEPSAKVHYFLNKAQQVGLPAWQGEVTSTSPKSTVAEGDIVWSE